jgi:hypothetical protein
MNTALRRCAHSAISAGVLCACVPQPQRYQNSVHPQYGAAEFMADLSRCRNENSTALVTTVDYQTHSTVRVNEVQTEGCLTRHGWEPASTAVSWLPPLYQWPAW